MKKQWIGNLIGVFAIVGISLAVFATPSHAATISWSNAESVDEYPADDLRIEWPLENCTEKPNHGGPTNGVLYGKVTDASKIIFRGLTTCEDLNKDGIKETLRLTAGGAARAGTQWAGYVMYDSDAIRLANQIEFITTELFEMTERGSQGWTQHVPVSPEYDLQWSSASSWSGRPYALPGSGVMQAEVNYQIGGNLVQGVWRGNQGWSRTVPIVNGQVC